jgi:AbrB family looped-hinge helix DNA binding protein
MAFVNTSSVTTNGQVTIPAEIRREFDIVPGDRVAFEVEDGHITLRPLRYTLAELEGILAPLPHMSDDFDTEIEEAMQERADELVRRLNER